MHIAFRTVFGSGLAKLCALDHIPIGRAPARSEGFLFFPVAVSKGAKGSGGLRSFVESDDVTGVRPLAGMQE